MTHLNRKPKWLESDCEFSPCHRYRFTLRRLWSRPEDSRPSYCCWVMLNPSTANEGRNDPTVERCERYARAWGFDGHFVVNLFAYRETDRLLMLKHREPTGDPSNKHWIVMTATRPDVHLVVGAWGADGAHLGRSREIKAALQSARVPLHYLSMTKGGEPGHPLYLRKDLKPQLWR